MIKQYFWNILIWIDQGLSTFTGGDPDETVSSRLGKSHRGDFGKTIFVLTYLPWFFVNCVFYIFDGWGHCEQSIEEDEGQNEVLLK